MTCVDLYYHSFDVEYDTDADETVNNMPVLFPDDVTVPAYSIVNIDMKIRVNLFCLSQLRFVSGLNVVPNRDILNTPLIYLLPDMPVNDGTYAIDLYIPVRNLSDVDYDIVAGTSLFSLINGANKLMHLRSVPDDHLTMELAP